MPPSLLLALLELDRPTYEALLPGTQERLMNTLYAVLGSTIIGDLETDEEVNNAIGHFLATAISSDPQTLSEADAARIQAMRARLRPALDNARLLG
jgi:hypothetical protein